MRGLRVRMETNNNSRCKRPRPGRSAGRNFRQTDYRAIPDGNTDWTLGRLMRTRRLLRAALRVWELKRGIRD